MLRCRKGLCVVLLGSCHVLYNWIFPSLFQGLWLPFKFLTPPISTWMILLISSSLLLPMPGLITTTLILPFRTSAAQRRKWKGTFQSTWRACPLSSLQSKVLTSMAHRTSESCSSSCILHKTCGYAGFIKIVLRKKKTLKTHSQHGQIVHQLGGRGEHCQQEATVWLEGENGLGCASYFYCW